MATKYAYCPIDGNRLVGIVLKNRIMKHGRCLSCQTCGRRYYWKESIIRTKPPKVTKKMLRYQAALAQEAHSVTN